MPRPFVVCLLVTALVTAGLSVGATEQAEVRGFFDLPIIGGTREYARLGLVPQERGIAITLLARQIYGQGAGNAERVLAQRRLAQLIGDHTAPGDQDAPPAESLPISIPLPLTADAWRDVLDVPSRGDLFIALVSNRAALLVCAGALATDDSVRALLDDDRGLLRWLVRTAPAGFALAGRSLRIVNGKVDVPGGVAAAPLWEALAVERVSKPADFIRAIVSRDAGRLAWFFDTLANMEPERLAMVLPRGPLDQVLEPGRATYASFRVADSNWRLEEHAFLRSAADPWMVATRIGIHERAIAGPAWPWLWQTVFNENDVSRRQATSIPRPSGPPVTFAWLAHEIATASPRERRDRFEMVRFAQGVFGGVTEKDGVDILVALGGYRRYRSALLALDRMDITAPALYGRVVDAARRVTERSGREQRHGLVAFQAALAIIERARVVRTIDVITAERLVRTLCDAVDRDTPVTPAVSKWLTTTLVPALPPLVERDRFSGETTIESTLLQAMAGPVNEPAVRDVEWEGLPYRVDLAASERRRMLRIREQLQSPGLDRAIESGQPAQLTDALLTLVYTPAMGDPEGPALLSRDVPLRHDFGLEAVSGARREFVPWLPPREQVGDGGPWHVWGSILGMDVGLARLALRRIDDNDMPAAPSINLNDEITLARTAVAINPRDLTDAARDELVVAIERGRDRVARAGHNLVAVADLAREVRLPPVVRRTLPWTVARTPESILSLFGLRDLMWLGAPNLTPTELDRWGVYAEALDSRVRTAMPSPAGWEDFGGRAEAGMMGTQVPDLTLRLAQETARLKLPARLIPSLLAYATQDYWHDVEARFPDDLPAMTRQALALSSSRVEDYVAALTGDGPLRPK